MGEALWTMSALCDIQNKLFFNIGQASRLLQWGPPRPSYLCTDVIYCDRCVIGLDLGLLFDALPLWDLIHVPLETLWCQDLSLLATHAVPVASALWRAVPWVPHSIRMVSVMGLGCPWESFWGSNNGCALFLLLSLTPCPCLSVVVALFLVTYHKFHGQAGEGKGIYLR